MEKSSNKPGPGLSDKQKPAIRFLVESALRTVISKTHRAEPTNREEWSARLCEALMSETEVSYQSVIASLVASGVRTEDVFQTYVPAAAQYLGELWISDQASFVDVTIAASRLQALFRTRSNESEGRWLDRSIPLGQSVLMVVPEFEQHSLGAFVAADNLRRHGLWVHMAIGLSNEEVSALVASSRFAMIGVSVATRNSVEKVTELVDYIRTSLDEVPPIVVGGIAVEDPAQILRRTGADHAVNSAQDAIRKCGLASVSEALPFDGVR